MNQVTEIYKDRLLSNTDLASADVEYRDWLYDVGLPIKNAINVQSGKILISDPMYLCDNNFYLKDDDPAGMFLKENGVVLTNFGGDVSGPVTRCSGDGYKIILTHNRINEDGYPIFQGESGAIPQPFLVAEQSPGIDSGGLIFIDYSPKLNELIDSQIQSMEDDMYLLVDAKPGEYWIGYEQWDIDPEYPYPEWYRNIVIMPI